MKQVMESFLNKCSNVSCSQNSFSKDKHGGTGEVCSTEDTPAAQHRACYVSRGVDATFLGTHERDDRCHTSSFGQGHQRQSHTMLVTHTHSTVATETGSAIPAAAPAYGLQHQAGF